MSDSRASTHEEPTADRRRVLAVLAVAGVLVAGTAVFLVDAVREDRTSTPTAGVPSASIESSAQRVVFRRTSVDDAYGTVGMTPAADGSSSISSTRLRCERIHVSSAAGICLAGDRGVVTSARALLLDADLDVVRELPVPGIPSRARVSPDGQWAATTTFVSGHSYASDSLSTVTSLYDVAAGRSLGNLERWDTRYRDEPFSAVDLNVWGVSFIPGEDAFYATIKTGGRVYLTRGEVGERRLTMLDVQVECPSVSPSGDRIAFKHAIGRGQWQLKVRDLATGEEVVLAETRNVDDQVEWLDDERILYGLFREGSAETDIWVVPADGSGQPEVFLQLAASPAVVR
jgi:dipeptidyl aminopeptidase/acylaminoacyl peptidase